MSTQSSVLAAMTTVNGVLPTMSEAMDRAAAAFRAMGEAANPWTGEQVAAMMRGFAYRPRKARGLRIHARRLKAAKRRG